jgi:hypothetical protein
VSHARTVLMIKLIRVQPNLGLGAWPWLGAWSWVLNDWALKIECFLVEMCDYAHAKLSQWMR